MAGTSNVIDPLDALLLSNNPNLLTLLNGSNIAEQIDDSTDICYDCFDLDLERSPSAVVTNINGIERRQATIDVGFGEIEPHTKNCGYCAMIRSALFACVRGYTGHGNAYLHLAAITMVRGEPLLLTLEDWAASGPGSRFGVEVYRDSQVTIPELSWIGACAPNVKKQTTSKSWSDFVLQCLKECDENHDACVKSCGRLPSRILDLGQTVPTTSQSVEADLRLVATEKLGNQRYAALSHCWGPSGIAFKLKHATLNAFRERIAFKDLPPTHKDAIIAARKLGIRYLWIDSLCIIQDSEVDLQKETAVMGDIYSNAFVTLAAVSSASSQEPFLDVGNEPFPPHKIRFRGRRLPSRLKSILQSLSPAARRDRVYLYARLTQRNVPPKDNSVSSSAQEGISDAIFGPLSKRAWTLQERALSRRIVHFTTEGVRFECQSYLKTEDGLLTTPGYLSRWHFIEALRSSPIGAPERTRHELQKFWRRMLKDYTQRAITFRADLLPALSGLAARMQNLHGAEYIAGLWRDTLIEDLCWTIPAASSRFNRTILPVCKEDVNVPTWSWVSVQSPACYPVIDEQGTFIPHCEVVHVAVDVVGSRWNKFGRVQSGDLILRGPARKAMLRMYHNDLGSIEFGQGADSRLEPDTLLTCCEMRLDGMTQKYWRRALEDEECLDGEAEVLCLRVGSWGPDYPTTGLTSMAIDFIMVLGRSDQEPDAYQRLGVLERDYGGQKFEDLEGTVGLMRKNDELLANIRKTEEMLAKMKNPDEILAKTNTDASPRASADGAEDWLRKMKEQPAYPAPQVMEVRIV